MVVEGKVQFLGLVWLVWLVEYERTTNSLFFVSALCGSNASHAIEIIPCVTWKQSHSAPWTGPLPRVPRKLIYSQQRISAANLHLQALAVDLAFEIDYPAAHVELQDVPWIAAPSHAGISRGHQRTRSSTERFVRTYRNRFPRCLKSIDSLTKRALQLS